MIPRRLNSHSCNLMVMLIYLLCNYMYHYILLTIQGHRGRDRMVVGFTTTMYLFNQCLSPLTLWVWIPLRWGVLDTTLCDKVCQWLATGRWFSLDTLVSSTNKSDHHDITELLMKVALNTINQTKPNLLP